jgi:ABC-type oligopeptide transport system ATPase subunit
MRIGKILEEPARFHFKMKGDELKDEITGCLEDVGLAPATGNKYPHELSGGQRQRVVIARALIMKPELLVADEPVSSLDVSVQAQILRLLSDMNGRGISIVFITHDLRIVKNFADRLIVLRQGRIVEEGGVEQIYKSPASGYTKLLLASIPNSPYKYGINI